MTPDAPSGPTLIRLAARMHRIIACSKTSSRRPKMVRYATCSSWKKNKNERNSAHRETENRKGHSAREMGQEMYGGRGIKKRRRGGTRRCMKAVQGWACGILHLHLFASRHSFAPKQHHFSFGKLPSSLHHNDLDAS